MSRHHYKIVAALGLMTLGLFGCEMEQEVPIPDHEPRLTLRLALTNTTPDSTHYINEPYNQLFIGRSQSVLDADEELAGVTNATVTLYNESGQAVESYSHIGKRPNYYYGTQGLPGYYDVVNGFIPDPDKTYTLRVSAPGFKPIEATVRMPAATRITEASLSELTAAPYSSMHLEGALRVSFEDRLNEENFYKVVAYPLDSAGNMLTFSRVYPQRDQNGPEFGVEKELWLENLFTDEFYQSGQITLLNRVTIPTFDVISTQGGVRRRNAHFVEVQVQQFTRDEYLFYKTLSEQWSNDGNPFAEYTQVHSNVRNGYGVLGGVTISRQVIPIR